MQQKGLFLCLLAIFISSIITAKPVVRWIHGLGSNCILESGLKSYFTDFNVECIETGPGYINSFENQIESACSQLEKEADQLSGGFTLMGFSQGGLIARGVLQRCSVGKYIRRLITFGAPHSGVAIIPFTGETNFMNKSVLKLCFYKFTENWVGPCGYIRSTRYWDSYHNAGNVIADLNNEFEMNEEYKERVKGLDVFMAVQFLSDHMVQPRNTSVFGYFKNDQYEELTDVENLDLFTQDKIGLASLENEGKFLRCDIDGDHLQIDDDDMESFAVLAAHPDSSLETIKNDALVQKRCRFK